MTGAQESTPTGPRPHVQAMTETMAGNPPWSPATKPGDTTIEALAAIVLMSGEMPWLPSIVFSADPLLAAYLRACLRRYTPERRAQVLKSLKEQSRGTADHS